MAGPAPQLMFLTYLGSVLSSFQTIAGNFRGGGGGGGGWGTGAGGGGGGGGGGGASAVGDPRVSCICVKRFSCTCDFHPFLSTKRKN